VGLRVRVVAKDPPMQTTSAVAGANWGPFLAEDSRILGWSRVTRDALVSVAAHVPSAGVSLVRGLEVSSDAAQPPLWARLIPDFAPARTVPEGYRTGWWFTAPVVDMRLYLNYLEEWLAHHGTRVEIGTFSSLEEAQSGPRLVVNCSGLGARKLAQDSLVHPVRGQLVVVPNPGLDYFFQNDTEEGELTYFMPQGPRVILGGMAVTDDETTDPDEKITSAIMRRCAAIEPILRDLPVLEQRSGLRPGRSSIRVEVEWFAGKPVIHNYGHGGSGLTVSWGCATWVQDYAVALLRRKALDYPPRPRAAADQRMLAMVPDAAGS
jgi:D-amino-acid oxidase